jgi:hypothetical protein
MEIIPNIHSIFGDLVPLNTVDGDREIVSFLPVTESLDKAHGAE